jgi:DtxR family Mn-dependent transcriptional regulator
MEKHTREAEEYLETLARMKESGREPTVSALAAELGVSKASVTEMLKKMAGRGLVRYARYGTPELTQTGSSAGDAILRKHRVIQRFLSFLGIRKERLHAEACLLEHAVSEGVEKGMVRAMRRGGFGAIPLVALGKGRKGMIVRIEAGGRASRRLADLGLTKGALVRVAGSASFGGPLRVAVRGTVIALGRSIARQVFVEAVD